MVGVSNLSCSLDGNGPCPAKVTLAGGRSRQNRLHRGISEEQGAQLPPPHTWTHLQADIPNPCGRYGLRPHLQWRLEAQASSQPTLKRRGPVSPYLVVDGS